MRLKLLILSSIFCFMFLPAFCQTTVFERTVYANNYNLNVFKSEFDSSVYVYKQWKFTQPFNSIDLMKFNSVGSITNNIAMDISLGSVQKIIPQTNGFLAGSIKLINNSTGLTKFTHSGNVVWSKLFEHSNGVNLTPSIIDEQNNSILLIGSPSIITPGVEELFLMKCDSNGLINSTNVYSVTSGFGTYGFVAKDLFSLSNGNYLFVSRRITSCATCQPPYLLELDSAFNIISGSQLLTSIGSPYAFKFIKKPDDGFYVIGSVMSNTPENFLYGFVINLTPSLTPIWAVNTNNFNFNFGLEFVDASLTSDGGLIIGGNFSNQDGWSDMVLMKMDSSGSIQWNTRYGKDTDDEILISMVYSQNDGIYLAGGGFDTTFSHSQVNGLLRKTDLLGKTICDTSTFSTGLNTFNVLFSPETYTKSSITITSSNLTTTQQPGLTFVHTCDGVVSGFNEFSLKQNISIYPNPASTKINISGHLFQSDDYFELKDIRGTVHLKHTVFSSESNVSIPISYLRNGMYFLHGQTSQGTFIKKVVVQNFH